MHSTEEYRRMYVLAQSEGQRALPLLAQRFPEAILLWFNPSGEFVPAVDATVILEKGSSEGLQSKILAMAKRSNLKIRVSVALRSARTLIPALRAEIPDIEPFDLDTVLAEPLQ